MDYSGNHFPLLPLGVLGGERGNRGARWKEYCRMAMVGLASGAVQCGRVPMPRPVSVKVMARTPDTQSGDFHTSLARRNFQIAQMAWKSCLSNYAQCPGMSLAAFMYHCTWSLEPHARACVYGSTCQLRRAGHYCASATMYLSKGPFCIHAHIAAFAVAAAAAA